jgi:hypothetical protein
VRHPVEDPMADRLGRKACIRLPIKCAPAEMPG